VNPNWRSSSSSFIRSALSIAKTLTSPRHTADAVYRRGSIRADQPKVLPCSLTASTLRTNRSLSASAPILSFPPSGIEAIHQRRESREKKLPKANSLPTQGSLRQLLRNFVVFRRFGESIASNQQRLLHNCITNLAFLPP
jgi:hypothetical protein